MSMEKGDKYVWKYLIENGGIVKEWSYYGSSYSFDDKKTRACKKAIETHGIDWKKSRAPTSDHESGFLGTFCEEQDRISVLKGELWVNGVRYEWGMELPEPTSILDFISGLLPEPDYKGF